MPFNRVISRAILQIQFVSPPACAPNGTSSNALLVVAFDQYVGLQHIVRYERPRLPLVHKFKMLEEGGGEAKVG